MATVSFGSFSKRRNSTKQPTAFTDSRTVTLKESCSQERPVFICTGNDFNYNYCIWDNKYYFIDEIVSLKNNMIEIQCIMDPLATYKTEILNTVAYVLYDTVSNTELPDNRLPIKTTKSVQANSAACPLVPDAGGTYILSLTGAHGTTGVYKCSQSEVAALIDDLNDIYDNLFDYEQQHPAPNPPTGSVNVYDWFEYWIEWAQWLWGSVKYPITQLFGSGNIPENIRECRYLPFNIGTTAGTTHIYLGTFETQQDLSKLVTDTVVRSATVSIPWQASDFRRRSPYTEVYLYIPYIGMVRLSSENLAGQSSITVDYAISVRDGSVVCTVSSGSEVLGQYPGNVSASVPIGFSNISLSKAGQAVLSGVISAAAKNIGAVGMSALNFADSVTPNYTCIGGLDGIAGIASPQNIVCYTVFHDTIVAPNTQLQTVGSPSMCPKALSGLTGYCQCLDAHVEAPATVSELAAIDGFLNSGFFIE